MTEKNRKSGTEFDRPARPGHFGLPAGKIGRDHARKMLILNISPFFSSPAKAMGQARLPKQGARGKWPFAPRKIAWCRQSQRFQMFASKIAALVSDPSNRSPKGEPANHPSRLRVNPNCTREPALPIGPPLFASRPHRAPANTSSAGVMPVAARPAPSKICFRRLIFFRPQFFNTARTDRRARGRTPLAVPSDMGTFVPSRSRCAIAAGCAMGRQWRYVKGAGVLPLPSAASPARPCPPRTAPCPRFE